MFSFGKIIPWYTTFSKLHKPFIGQLILILRFHFFLLVSLSLFTPLEFFTSALADSLSQGFEWQRVSSSLQDSSKYSDRSEQCCSLDGLHSSFKFQVLQYSLNFISVFFLSFPFVIYSPDFTPNERCAFDHSPVNMVTGSVMDNKVSTKCQLSWRQVTT